MCEVSESRSHMTERAIQDTYELERLAEEAEVRDVVDESADLIDQATSDAVYRYFRDVGGHQLLTHREEIEYSRAVRAGLEARKPLEAGADWEAVHQTTERAEAARGQLTRHNPRLVVSIATK